MTARSTRKNDWFGRCARGPLPPKAYTQAVGKCATFGVPWRGSVSAGLAWGVFQHVVKSAENAEHSETAGHTYEGTPTIAWYTTAWRLVPSGPHATRAVPTPCALRTRDRGRKMARRSHWARWQANPLVPGPSSRPPAGATVAWLPILAITSDDYETNYEKKANEISTTLVQQVALFLRQPSPRPASCASGDSRGQSVSFRVIT